MQWSLFNIGVVVMVKLLKRYFSPFLCLLLFSFPGHGSDKREVDVELGKCPSYYSGQQTVVIMLRR